MSVPVGYGGLQVGASSRPLPEPTFSPDMECRVTKGGWWQRNYACGHRSSRRFKVEIFGRGSEWIRQKAECPGCFLETQKKQFALCALCGAAIAPGDPVAIYVASSLEPLPEEATVLDGGGVVGCLGWDCCPTGGFFAGNWTGRDVESAF